MYKLKLNDQTIDVGTHLVLEASSIEIGNDDAVGHVEFKVIGISKDVLNVMWVTGPHEGAEAIIPYSILASVGINVELKEISNDVNDPNIAFRMKKNVY